MSKINQDLLQAIADKQNMVLRAVYPQITKVVHETFLERDLAALVLASRLRININKYSKPDQREQIRGFITGISKGFSELPPQAIKSPSVPRGRNKAKGTTRRKDNSVFVIGGRDTALTES